MEKHKTTEHNSGLVALTKDAKRSEENWDKTVQGVMSMTRRRACAGSNTEVMRRGRSGCVID